jgi:hypothetical protein
MEEIQNQIQSAIHHAFNAKPSEFKSDIHSSLTDRVQNHIEIRRMELAGSIFDEADDENLEDLQQQTETEFQSSSEENVDEEL